MWLRHLSVSFPVIGQLRVNSIGPSGPAQYLIDVCRDADNGESSHRCTVQRHQPVVGLGTKAGGDNIPSERIVSSVGYGGSTFQPTPNSVDIDYLLGSD
jgi:hypothetical protein